MKKLVIVVTFVVFLVRGTLSAVYAAQFFCPAGNVTCLIAAITQANATPGEHIITLAPGTYTLQAVNNVTDGLNGLPSITSSILIQASSENPPTIIERDPAAPLFRIFHVSAGGELSLESVTLQNGDSTNGGSAIRNRGVTWIRNSIIRNSGRSDGEFGAIYNSGELTVSRSIITENRAGHQGGGINNQPEGNVFVEYSTISNNIVDGGGGIFNTGTLVVRNSAIVFNGGAASGGGGIVNVGFGFVEIVNSTIAQNQTSDVGAGVFNGDDGHVSIINSTIRENFDIGGSIFNDLGSSILVQNTIIAGNTSPDCLGVIWSLGNNLIGDPSGCTINLQPSDLTGDPGLGALVGAGQGDPAGRAFYPVLAGSPVIDAASPAACPQIDQLGNLRQNTCDIGAIEFQGKMLVAIDVKPRSEANKINPKSKNSINVAILSVDGFDATTVDPKTVRFGATGTEASPIRVVKRDPDHDDDRDLVLRFEIRDTEIECGDTSATLTGQTFDGIPIIGSSPIQTVSCKKHKGPHHDFNSKRRHER